MFLALINAAELVAGCCVVFCLIIIFFSIRWIRDINKMKKG